MIKTMCEQSKLIVEVETEKYGTMRQVGKQYWLEDAAKGTQGPSPTPPPPAKHPGTPFLQGIKVKSGRVDLCLKHGCGFRY